MKTNPFNATIPAKCYNHALFATQFQEDQTSLSENSSHRLCGEEIVRKRPQLDTNRDDVRFLS